MNKVLVVIIFVFRFNVTKGIYTWDFKTEPAKQKKKGKGAKDDEGR